MINSSAYGATVGAVEHGNSAILVTIDPDLRCIDRRRIDLTTGLPTHPYHHEGSWALGRYTDSPWARPVSLEDAIDLIRQVQAAAAAGAQVALDALASTVDKPITHFAVRACPNLPETIEATLRDHRAQLVADSILYRTVLARAAADRGWNIVWYERREVRGLAAQVLRVDDPETWVTEIGKSLGAPWRAEHKLAALAAIATRLAP
jgi:hypothetical protein